MTWKNRKSKNFCPGVEPPETDIVLITPRHQLELIGRLEFESELTVGHEKVKIRVV